MLTAITGVPGPNHVLLVPPAGALFIPPSILLKYNSPNPSLSPPHSPPPKTLALVFSGLLTLRQQALGRSILCIMEKVVWCMSPSLPLMYKVISKNLFFFFFFNDTRLLPQFSCWRKKGRVMTWGEKSRYLLFSLGSETHCCSGWESHGSKIYRIKKYIWQYFQNVSSVSFSLPHIFCKWGASCTLFIAAPQLLQQCLAHAKGIPVSWVGVWMEHNLIPHQFRVTLGSQLCCY